MTALPVTHAHPDATQAMPIAAGETGTRAPSTLSTLNDDGSRRWLKPKLSPGRFLSRRRAVAYALIALFTAIPHTTINGWPAILLDLSARRFHILGQTFLPTDTLLLAFLLVGIFLTIFLLTALFGRVWCGWACPQTVYMEFVFRPIERLFDGAPGRAIKNKFQGTGPARTLKYVAFFLVACYLAHTFLAYFVGVERLSEWVTQSPLRHPGPFLVMAVVTGLMLFDFTFFREQTCLVACPYGRFQSVMLDRHSLIVSYDPVRGEPRGKASAKRAAATDRADLALPVLAGEARRTGDCVDCKLCVVTCPTGIDIRNGLQMECINCTQCIDACDAVMTKLGRPRGLIRYTSQAAVSGGTYRMIRPRVVIYATVLAGVVTAFLITLLGAASADVSVLRGRGAPFVQVDPGTVANQVRVKIANRSAQATTFTFDAAAVAGAPGVSIRAEDHPVRVEAGEVRTVPAQILVPVGAFVRGTLDVHVLVSDGQGFSTRVPFRVVGPAGGQAPGVAAPAQPAPPTPDTGGTP
ncbi:MAG: cytochrome c oxidase accessory protein CcoG [Planctomycetota bacterium]|nr:cytochrome c oxidase accessory protein CcoG [Planctomycetota bacterium]